MGRKVIGVRRFGGMRAITIDMQEPGAVVAEIAPTGLTMA